mgnify:CR=1 FL=1
MDKQLLKQILRDNQQEVVRYKIEPREFNFKAFPCCVLVGVRRSGKSYLLRILFKNYLINNGVKENHIIELDLENRRNKKYRNPDSLIEYIDSQMVDDDMYYILLDELF